VSYSRDNVHNEETNCCACPMPGNLEFLRHMDRSFLCSMNLGEKYRIFLLILVGFFYHHCLNFLFIVNLKNKSNRRCDEHELIKALTWGHVRETQRSGVWGSLTVNDLYILLVNNLIWCEYCNLICWSAWRKCWLYLITWVGIVISPTYSFTNDKFK
jgi:hypothetical protein